MNVSWAQFVALINAKKEKKKKDAPQKLGTKHCASKKRAKSSLVYQTYNYYPPMQF